MKYNVSINLVVDVVDQNALDGALSVLTQAPTVSGATIEVTGYNVNKQWDEPSSGLSNLQAAGGKG